VVHVRADDADSAFGPELCGHKCVKNPAEEVDVAQGAAVIDAQERAVRDRRAPAAPRANRC
jgi:hypothetical protein